MITLLLVATGLMQLFETVQNMQAQLRQVHETALNLAAEKEDRQNHIDVISSYEALLFSHYLATETLVLDRRTNIKTTHRMS